MTVSETTVRDGRACAGVVLYKPDRALLAKQAEGLLGQTLFAFANGPVDAQVLAALAPADLRLIRSDENVGLGRGLNAISDAALRDGFSHILLLDQDSEPPPDLLDRLTARSLALEAHGENVAVLAPRLVPPSEGFYKPIRYEWRGRPRGDGLAALDFAPTSGSLMSLAAFREIGPFRDDFFIGGLDVEWGFRAWSRGWASYLATELAMPHRWGEAASGSEAGTPQILRHSRLRNYYYARNVVATAQLPHVPLRWRLKSCAALAAQSGLLAVKGAAGAFAAVRAGVADGWRNQLGPAPDTME